MHMKNAITITSKGQTTLPSAIRRKLGVPKQGGVLQITFDERRGELTIKRPLSVSELSSRVSKHIKPGTVPLREVDEYYQRNRQTGGPRG